MRSEDDLRTALTSLEEHAPVAARVLPGISPRRPRRGMRSPLALRWVAGIAATAAVAGAITAVTVTSGTSSSTKNAPVAASSVPASVLHAKTVQAKLLAAINSTAGDILYSRTELANGEIGQAWQYPSLPAIGQQVRAHNLSTANGKVDYDSEMIFTETNVPTATNGLVVITPKLEDAAPAGESISVDYQNKTWYDQKVPHMLELTSNAADPSSVIANIKSGNYKEVGHGTVDGHQAIEFYYDWKAADGGDVEEHLWVDASTFTLLRVSATTLWGNQKPYSTATMDFQFLPPTPANLAKLTPSIPAGFKQVAPPSTSISATPSATPKSSASASPK